MSQPIRPPAGAPPGFAPAGQTYGDASGIVPRGTTPVAGVAPVDPAADDKYVGKVLDGRYALDSVLGEGGMGVVYAGRHTMIGKRVAVKILRAEYARDKEIVDRFVLEARTASSIGNPHIVDISDFGKLPDGGTYFVMEFLDGESLADAMVERAPGPAGPTKRPRIIEARRICHIAKQVCDGLGAAHERNIVHRDLKPDNIFLLKRSASASGPVGLQDFVKILDFGIAKVTNSATQKLTRAGAVFGTPQYMSPEQAAGATIDHRSDIYSLGVILYEMASGRLPFDDETFMGILTAHMYRAPVPVRALVNNAECPPGLEAIIQKCLAKRPELRYQTMAELAADLARVEANEAPRAIAELMARPGDSIPQDYLRAPVVALAGEAPPQPQRAPMWVWIVAVLGTIVIVGGGLALKRHRERLAAAQASAATATGPTGASPLETAPRPSTTAAVDAVPTATASASAGGATSAPKHVVLDVAPPAAVVKRDGKALASHEVEVPPGESITLEVSAPGYVSKEVVVDGSAPKVPVVLARSPAVRPGAPPSGGGKVVPTW
jgi:serine/threonine-protein kinase